MFFSLAGLEFLGKALLSGVLAYFVGWERQRHGHEAGIRTLALVATGTTILTAFAIADFPANADRIIANIVTGVGFLGAGRFRMATPGKCAD